MEAVNKMCRKAPEPTTVTTIFKVDEIETLDSEIKRLSDLDPRIPEEEIRAHPDEDLILYQLDPEHPERIVLLDSKFNPDIRAELEHFLQDHKDVFAWSHEDMPGIDPAVMCHQSCVNPNHKPVAHKRRAFNPERYEAINAEVKKLLAASFIQEMTYPKWLANVVLV